MLKHYKIKKEINIEGNTRRVGEIVEMDESVAEKVWHGDIEEIKEKPKKTKRGVRKNG